MKGPMLSPIQRSLIQDALSILLTNPNVHPTRMAYVRFEGDTLKSQDAFFQVQAWAQTNKNKVFHSDPLKSAKLTKCYVCALGALFLAYINREEAPLGLLLEGDSFKVRSHLRTFFTLAELGYMEALFGGSTALLASYEPDFDTLTPHWKVDPLKETTTLPDNDLLPVLVRFLEGLLHRDFIIPTGGPS